MCNLNAIGDEFHYLLVCDAFKRERVLHLKRYYYINPSNQKMAQLISSNNISVVKKLCKFITAIKSCFEWPL